jgi:hypothetical protein
MIRLGLVPYLRARAGSGASGGRPLKAVYEPHGCSGQQEYSLLCPDGAPFTYCRERPQPDGLVLGGAERSGVSLTLAYPWGSIGGLRCAARRSEVEFE